MATNPEVGSQRARVLTIASQSQVRWPGALNSGRRFHKASGAFVLTCHSEWGGQTTSDVVDLARSRLRQSLASSVTRRPPCVRPADSERKFRREPRSLDASTRGSRKAVSRQ